MLPCDDLEVYEAAYKIQTTLIGAVDGEMIVKVGWTARKGGRTCLDGWPVSREVLILVAIYSPTPNRSKPWEVIQISSYFRQVLLRKD